MELSTETIKQGSSEVGAFKVNYSIVYDSDSKVTKIDAQFKRKSTDTIAEIYMGSASYSESRYNLSLTNKATTDERESLIDEFEKTIAELVK